MLLGLIYKTPVHASFYLCRLSSDATRWCHAACSLAPARPGPPARQPGLVVSGWFRGRSSLRSRSTHKKSGDHPRKAKQNCQIRSKKAPLAKWWQKCPFFGQSSPIDWPDRLQLEVSSSERGLPLSLLISVEVSANFVNASAKNSWLSLALALARSLVSTQKKLLGFGLFLLF